MPVEPIPCAPEGGGGTPVEITTCCAPSIASTPLCREDGTTVLLVVRSGCAECGTAAGDPEVAGWLDAAGTFTPGPAPADAGPCDAGCVDTVCRTRCDDTDGDGSADATYTELWCIRADGTAELVLTYQDDPSTPYTPTAPVECEYGCQETETLTLCDDVGPFLRRYTWLQGVATYEDWELDGVTPHVVTGTVTTCAGTSTAPEECAERTTPAATLGLCLPDGTPLAVLITRDCDGTTTQDGWLNLLTGTYTAGPPPVGAAACGDARAFELAGLLCDVDPATGDVLGLVLVEYEYNADGSLAGVRLVDPGTGATYTLQGELRRCPADGPELPDQDFTVLCDVQADGTRTAFVRDYRRDPATGQVTGHTDYTLDGQPYTVTGTPGLCQPEPESCRNTSTVLLCDADGVTRTVTPTITDGTVAETGYAGNAAFPPLAGSWAPLWTGGSLVFAADADGTAGDGIQAYRTVVGHIVGDVPENCATATGEVTLSVRVTLDGPNPGAGGDGWLRVWRDGVQLATETVQVSAPVGHVQTLTVTLPATPDDLAAGRLVFALALETFHGTSKSWTADQFTVSAGLDGCAVQFLRSVTVDCETGQVVSVADTTLDGQPYTVTGEVGQCATAGGGECCPPEPCRNTSTVLLCDQGAAPGVEAIPFPIPAGPTSGTLPSGITWNVDRGTWANEQQGYHIMTGAQAWTFSEPVLLEWTYGGLSGPGECVRLPAGVELVSLGADHTYDPATRTLCPINGSNTTFSTFKTTGPVASLVWEAVGAPQLGRGIVSMDVTRPGDPVQFLRAITVDCATGETVSVADTTLDGLPYTVTGEVGQCVTAGGGECCPPESCRNTSTVLLCDLTEQEAPATPTVTDAPMAGANGTAPPPPYVTPLPGSYTALWTGGALSFPADADGSAGDGSQVYRAATGALAIAEDCDGGTATVAVSLQVENLGPGTGRATSGRLELWNGTTRVGMSALLNNTPPNQPQTLTATADVTVEDIKAGQVTATLWLETFHVDSRAWTADQFTVDVTLHGCPTQFLRNLTVDCATGETVAVTDTTLDGLPYTVGGQVGQCTAAGGGEVPPPEPCRDSTALLVCDLPTGGAPTATVTDTDPTPYYPFPTAAPVTGAQVLWDGGTLNLAPGTAAQPGTTGSVNSAAATLQAPRPACDTGTARVTVALNVQQTGPDDGCGQTGHLRIFNGTTQVGLTVLPAGTPAGYFGTLTVEADVPAADLAAGNVAFALALDAFDDNPTACSPSPRRTGWQLSGFTVTAVYDQAGCETQFLRTVLTDCESGAVLTVTDTTLDGLPYEVTGEVGQCTAAGGGECCPLPEPEPCGDTEVLELCDLTYDPQAPIPTPARDWTLTGNVVTANDGTTLWFAQANQEANGVAEIIVSGLLPATRYEFRFASAWIGAGGSDPVGNAAIYRLDVLDGATVLATRTRNVSNGSSTFPGGVLTEDLPPLAFIAPATGAVTIRFTDQTTGGAVNDRDLFLMPYEVRTESLTIERTPFLRRLTFDCAGVLTSTEDVALDGATPYAVQGEVGQCAGDGAAAPGVPPCDAQNVLSACRCDDTTGDGTADTEYVELLAVDCDGALSSIGTYTPDLSAPYTPVAPVDCATADPGPEPAVGVQAHRVELTPGASWDAATVTALRSVTAVAHGADGQITTVDGTSTLHRGEAVTWSIDKDTDAALVGPLTITAAAGVITVAYTTGVNL